MSTKLVGVARLDSVSLCGWQGRIMRRGILYTKYFDDRTWGARISKWMAEAWVLRKRRALDQSTFGYDNPVNRRRRAAARAGNTRRSGTAKYRV
jgi:hypothetical protein